MRGHSRDYYPYLPGDVFPAHVFGGLMADAPAAAFEMHRDVQQLPPRNPRSPFAAQEGRSDAPTRGWSEAAQALYADVFGLGAPSAGFAPSLLGEELPESSAEVRAHHAETRDEQFLGDGFFSPVREDRPSPEIPDDLYQALEWDLGAEEEELLHFAQSRSQGRVFRNPNGRIITIPESIRWDIWNHNIEQLRRIDPSNPMLVGLSTPDWVPRNADIYRLRQEVIRVRAAKRLGDQIHGHHSLPKQFDAWFRVFPRDIWPGERDLSILFLPRERHVGRGALHPPWNRDFEAFSDHYPKASRESVYDHVQGMFHRYGLGQ
jgi:hypothetical protein